MAIKTISPKKTLRNSWVFANLFFYFKLTLKLTILNDRKTNIELKSRCLWKFKKETLSMTTSWSAYGTNKTDYRHRQPHLNTYKHINWSTNTVEIIPATITAGKSNHVLLLFMDYFCLYSHIWPLFGWRSECICVSACLHKLVYAYGFVCMCIYEPESSLANEFILPNEHQKLTINMQTILT